MSEPLTQDGKAYALALVRAHIMQEPNNVSWVPAYTTVRWAPRAQECVTTRVGGHYRRKPHVADTLAALTCTCKMEDLTNPNALPPPIRALSKSHKRKATGDPTYSPSS
jgi:hypothetical protein